MTFQQRETKKELLTVVVKKGKRKKKKVSIVLFWREWVWKKGHAKRRCHCVGYFCTLREGKLSSIAMDWRLKAEAA